MKKKVLMSSIVTIVLCLTLIAGSTYALFTDREDVNIAVTTGTVDIDTKIPELRYWSQLGKVLPQSGAKFVEGKNEIEVKYMVPGDVLEFDIVVGNNSNVAVDYRTVLGVTSEYDNILWSGLVKEFRVNGELITYSEDENGNLASAWSLLEKDANGEDIKVSVKIYLPKEAGNEYQNTSCKFFYYVEAIQANHDGQ